MDHGEEVDLEEALEPVADILAVEPPGAPVGEHAQATARRALRCAVHVAQELAGRCLVAPGAAAAFVEPDGPGLGVTDGDCVSELVGGRQRVGRAERLLVAEQQVVRDIVTRSRRLHDAQPTPAQPVKQRPDDAVLGLRLV